MPSAWFGSQTNQCRQDSPIYRSLRILRFYSARTCSSSNHSVIQIGLNAEELDVGRSIGGNRKGIVRTLKRRVYRLADERGRINCHALSCALKKVRRLPVQLPKMAGEGSAD